DYSQSWNPYSYVQNNPTNKTDPTGYDPTEATSAGSDYSSSDDYTPGDDGGYGYSDPGYGGHSGTFTTMNNATTLASDAGIYIKAETDLLTTPTDCQELNSDCAAADARTGKPVPGSTDGKSVMEIKSVVDVKSEEEPVSLREKIPYIDYYKERAQDFERRNPGLPLPDYYLNYGDKYAHRFTDELKPQLGERGKRWVDDTFLNLQAAMESRRDNNPREFAELERNSDAFGKFAYDTHPASYVHGGLASLDAGELAKIALTPDPGDLFTASGISQIAETGNWVMGIWIQEDKEEGGFGHP
ncbi:hypothetical protein ACWCQK_42560, partial [Streptomyces sp. NPDC002306]